MPSDGGSIFISRMIDSGSGARGGELRLQIAELGAARQPAVPQQVADLLEGREPRQVVDVVAAIREHAAIAVEKQMAEDVATTSSRPALAFTSVDTRSILISRVPVCIW